MQPQQPDDVYASNFLRKTSDLEKLFLLMLKGGLNKQSRDEVGYTAARYVTNAVGPELAATASQVIEEPLRLKVKELQKTGYVYLNDVFSPHEIQNIKAYLETKKFHGDTEGRGESKDMLLGEVTPEISFGHFHQSDILRCEQFYRVIHDPNLLRMVARYLEAPPTIGIITTWWSFPAAGPPAGMQTFHHDRGDFRSCNLFVYLTDVDQGTGPHAFIERTHNMSVLLPLVSERFGREPKKFNAFWQWMEQHRKSDDEIRMFFPEQEIRVHTGPQGTSFLEDTRGLHKGTRPTTGRRLAFEIFYAVMPKFNESITPIARDSLSFSSSIETKSEALDPLVRYATRQFYL